MYRERAGRDNGRAVVPLPSLEHDAVYQEALKIVRLRRAKRAAGRRSERAESPQVEAAGHGQVPKYLRLSCILKPSSAQAPLPPKRKRARPRKEPRWLPLSWAELRETLGLTVVAGLQPLLLKLASGEHRLPTGVWLVLDPSTAQRLPAGVEKEGEEAGMEDGGDLPLGTRPCASKAWVAQKSVTSLQLLDEEQLTWSNAEANFAKCSRGACFLALKHAGFVLKALATKECIQAQQEGLEQEKPLEITLEEIDAKVNRAAGLVGSRAAAEARRRRPESRSPRKRPEEEAVAESSPRQAMSAQRRGVQAQRDFVNFVCRKYGNCMRLWFIIDPEENLKIAEKQFVRACEDIGFSGCLLTLWRQLDPDGTGHISFHDMDPDAALQLAEFKVLLMKQFDGQVENFLKTVETPRSQRVSRDAFMKSLDDMLQGARRLFELLCRHNSSTVSVRELRFLEKWWPPRYFLVPPDRGRLTHFRQALGDAAHGNALKAWFRLLDPEQNMKVTFRRFKTQLSRLQKLQEEDSSAQVWRAWDPDCTGYLFLRRFHPDSHEAAARLKRWAAKYGGVVKFISQLESLHGRVTKVTFRKALVDVLEHPATDLLFEGLDVGDTGHLGEQDVRFLDRWDLALEDELHGAEAPGSP